MKDDDRAAVRGGAATVAERARIVRAAIASA